MISIMRERGYSCSRIWLYGSDRSAGQVVEYDGHDLTIEHVDRVDDRDHDFAILCANPDVSRFVRDRLKSKSTVIIDNSSGFRMDDDVPLVIPEVNGSLIEESTRVVANPNCSTIILLSALHPIREAYGVVKSSVTTYQAVSGAGIEAIEELRTQTGAYIDGRSVDPVVFPVSCAMNVFEHESAINPIDGFNGEESKIINESRKILEDPHFRILPTCVRVPVERAHSQSIILELENPCTMDGIVRSLSRDGIRIFDRDLPLTPRDASGKDNVFVGRIRIDPMSDNRTVVLWICGDQLRKGAALNALQIMDLVCAKRNSKGSVSNTVTTRGLVRELI